MGKLIDKEVFLILICGLPGTGKTTATKRLALSLDQYAVIDQNEIRRKKGIRRMPKAQEIVLREIDRLTATYLRDDKGVIFDSVNRYSFRRHQMYGIASCCEKRVITLELVCSATTAKKRILDRPSGDGIISDPNDPAVYDKLKLLWENVEIDFKYPGEDHVAYLQFNSESNQLTEMITRRGMRKFIHKISKALGE